MKKILMLVVTLVFCTVGLRGDELPWQDDCAKALAEAAEKHQPVLLDFSASWCGPCRMMETTTFADPGVREELKGYLLVKIDLDRAHDLAAKYHVEAIPTCIVLNQFGETVDRHTGYLDAAHFAAWIHQCENSAYTRERQSENTFAMISSDEDRKGKPLPPLLSQADLIKQAATRLEAASETERKGGLESLLNTYCGTENREDGQAKLAGDELRAWFARHPDRAVPLLDERRLAVRILFSTLFAEKMGAAFQFDPWDSASNRAAVVERLAGQMKIQPR